MKNKGQTWSLDLIVAVVLFVIIIGLFYSFMAKEDSTTGDKLQDESKTLAYKLNCDYGENQGTCVFENGVLSEEQLISLYREDYDRIKEEWGIDNDFCIYLRDLDGNLFALDTTTGFGSNDLVLTGAGKRCGDSLIDDDIPIDDDEEEVA